MIKWTGPLEGSFKEGFKVYAVVFYFDILLGKMHSNFIPLLWSLGLSYSAMAHI